MAAKDKVLDVLALSVLPEHAKLARLAAQKVGKPFPLEEAKAVIRCYFSDWRGRLTDLTQRLVNEKLRQERLHNDRQAVKAALPTGEPYTKPFIGPPHEVQALRKSEHVRHAQSIFGRDIENNFDEDNLALMALIQGDIRHYTVSWLDGGSRPKPAALIEVGVMVDGIFTGQHRALLYKHEGRTYVASTEAGSVTDAFAGQVPRKLVELAPELHAQGCKITTDFSKQEMVVTTPEGDERRLPWNGKTVED